MKISALLYLQILKWKKMNCLFFLLDIIWGRYKLFVFLWLMRGFLVSSWNNKKTILFYYWWFDNGHKNSHFEITKKLIYQLGHFIFFNFKNWKNKVRLFSWSDFLPWQVLVFWCFTKIPENLLKVTKWQKTYISLKWCLIQKIKAIYFLQLKKLKK